MSNQMSDYLTNWLNEKGFDIKCKYAKDFLFDLDENELYFSLLCTDNHLNIFTDICKEIEPKLNTNIFVLNFFHELGHYMTKDKFSDEELNAHIKEGMIREELEPTEANLIEYYKNPIEYAATEWGCHYIVNNLEEVKSMFEGFSKLAEEYINSIC